MIKRGFMTIARLGLGMSIALWVTSFFLYVARAETSHVYTLRKGGLEMRDKVTSDKFDWRVYANPGLYPVWAPTVRTTGTLLVIVPFWVPTLGFAILWYFSRDLTRRNRRLKGLCVECGYSLAGLTVTRCPECGSEFEAPA